MIDCAMNDKYICLSYHFSSLKNGECRWNGPSWKANTCPSLANTTILLPSSGYQQLLYWPISPGLSADLNGFTKVSIVPFSSTEQVHTGWRRRRWPETGIFRKRSVARAAVAALFLETVSRPQASTPVCFAAVGCRGSVRACLTQNEFKKW